MVDKIYRERAKRYNCLSSTLTFTSVVLSLAAIGLVPFCVIFKWYNLTALVVEALLAYISLFASYKADYYENLANRYLVILKVRKARRKNNERT